MSFLPKDYAEPTMSPYMDFMPGENVFRILGEATLGWEYWTEAFADGQKKSRPTRVKEYDQIPLAEVVTNKFGNLNLSFFWAFPVYNFKAKRVQLLTIKQKTIRAGITGYVNNTKWGDPTAYNLVVTRAEGDSGKTEYSVIAEPKEALDPAILKKFKAMDVNMDAWMAGKDPFNSATEPTAETLGEQS